MNRITGFLTGLACGLLLICCVLLFTNKAKAQNKNLMNGNWVIRFYANAPKPVFVEVFKGNIEIADNGTIMYRTTSGCNIFSGNWHAECKELKE